MVMMVVVVVVAAGCCPAQCWQLVFTGCDDAGRHHLLCAPRGQQLAHVGLLLWLELRDAGTHAWQQGREALTILALVFELPLCQPQQLGDGVHDVEPLSALCLAQLLVHQHRHGLVAMLVILHCHLRQGID